jgi:RNA polymerase sigma-70 factor, ECF subfamily
VNPGNDARGAALLKRIADKDQKAFEEFYYLYSGGFGAFLMKMLKRQEWVDEAVNDVMLSVWQLADRYDPERGRLSTWLFGIAHNKGLKVLERLGRQREVQLEEPEREPDRDAGEETGTYEMLGVATFGPERVVIGWELGDAMSWAFSRLSADHRAVLELCFCEDCSYQEIADIMDCPINTVKTRLFHARKRLGELLAGKGITLPEQGKAKTS